MQFVIRSGRHGLKLVFWVILVLLGCTIIVNAQTHISKYEFWYNSDTGARTTINVIPTGVLTIDTVFSAKGLSAGVHSFNWHTLNDSGKWSAVTSSIFYINGGVKLPGLMTKCEYWFDEPTNARDSITFSPASIYSLDSLIPTTGLNSGLHSIYVRFLDDSGFASPVISSLFYIPGKSLLTGYLTGYEYWFDDSTKNRHYFAVNDSAILNFNKILTATFSFSGMHSFNIHFKDTSGLWSPVISNLVIMSTVTSGSYTPIVITHYEYWLDGDAKHRKSFAANNQSLFLLNNPLLHDSITDGIHTIYYHFEDSSGLWSPVIANTFIKQGTVLLKPALALCEYWFDNPATRDTLRLKGQQVYLFDSIFAKASITVGLHSFNVHFLDSNGYWSPVESYTIYKGINDTFPIRYIKNIRYFYDDTFSKVQTFAIDGKLTNFVLDTIKVKPFLFDIGQHILHVQFQDVKGYWCGLTNDTFFNAGKPVLNSITPPYGGNKGNLTVTINGVGFTDSVRMWLKKGTKTITIDTSTIKIASIRQFKCTIKLDSSDTGYWNVIVHTRYLNHDTDMVLVNGFYVDSSLYPHVTATLIGYNSILAHSFSKYRAAYTNLGNIDAVGVPVWLSIPDSVLYKFDFKIDYPTDSGIAWDTMSNNTIVDTLLGNIGKWRLFGFTIPIIRPNQTYELPFELKAPQIGKNYVVSTFISNSMFYNDPTNIQDSSNYVVNSGTKGSGYKSNSPNFVSDSLAQAKRKCLISLGKEVLGVVPFVGCGISIYDNFIAREEHPTPTILDFASTILDCSGIIGKAAKIAKAALLTKTMEKRIYKALEGANEIKGYVKNDYDCLEAFYPTWSDNLSLGSVFSHDPNAKFGPFGSGKSKFISNNLPLGYTIYFENDSVATAPAHTVSLIDTLDITKFDLSSFSFGEISIGDSFFINVEPYQQTLNLVRKLPGKYHIKVHISANLDKSSGIVSWLFTTIDSTTGQQELDPMKGFLPPNKIKPNGEANVFYTVKLLKNVDSNAVVKNRAYIYFDSNAVIPTVNWVNAVDKTPPVSKCHKFDSTTQKNDTIHVHWRGIDKQSGLKDYTIYYSVNGGKYSPWLIYTRDTMATFIGKWGSTYHFMSIARDSAGNIEKVKDSADASVTIMTVSTGIKSLSTNHYGLKVFPNPTKNAVSIEKNIESRRDVTLLISDNLGHVLYMKDCGRQIGYFKQEVDLSGFASGIYIVTLKEGESRSYQKLIKMN